MSAHYEVYSELLCYVHLSKQLTLFATSIEFFCESPDCVWTGPFPWRIDIRRPGRSGTRVDGYCYVNEDQSGWRCRRRRRGEQTKLDAVKKEKTTDKAESTKNRRLIEQAGDGAPLGEVAAENAHASSPSTAAPAKTHSWQTRSTKQPAKTHGPHQASDGANNTLSQDRRVERAPPATNRITTNHPTQRRRDSSCRGTR